MKQRMALKSLLLFVSLIFSARLSANKKYQHHIYQKIGHVIGHDIHHFKNSDPDKFQAMLYRGIRLLEDVSAIDVSDNAVYLNKVSEIVETFNDDIERQREIFDHTYSYPLNTQPILDCVNSHLKKIRAHSCRHYDSSNLVVVPFHFNEIR